MPRDAASGVFGRDAELESIGHFLDMVTTGPAALVISGDPGIGKTTIWRAAVVSAQRASYVVMDCRPSQAESELPYSGIGDLFAGVPDEVLETLRPPQRRALDVALLRVELEEGLLHQRAVSSAVLSVVTERARSQPVLLAIDDLQWMDSPSVRALRFALRRLTSARVGVLAAIRSGPSDRDPLGLGEAFPPEQLQRLALGPLDVVALDRVLGARLRTAFVGPTLRALYETSRGNPFFAIELGRAVLDPHAQFVAGRALPAPSNLPDLLATRLSPMSPQARRALLAASALARPTVGLIVAVAAGENGDQRVLDEAVDADIVTIEGGAVRFTHPLLSAAVYTQASTEERKDVHRQLAELVTDLEERARHVALAADAPDNEVAALLEAAASNAASRGAPDAAAALLEQTVTFTPPTLHDEVLRRTLDASDQHIAAGDTGHARALIERVLSTSSAGPTRARALHRAARVSTLMSEFLVVPGLLEQALGHVGDDVVLRASVERDLVWSLAQVGRVADLLPHGHAALRAAESTGQQALIAEALDHLCFAQYFVGEPIDPDLLERAMRLDEQVGIAPPVAHPGIAAGRMTLALTLKWTDAFGDAHRLLEALRAEHIEHGDEGALIPVLFHLGELECWAGNLASAARRVDECHLLAVRSDQPLADRRGTTLKAMVSAYRGDDDTVAITTMGLDQAEEAGDWPAIIRCLRSVGVYELSMGNTEAAVGHLVRGIAVEASVGYDAATVRIVPDAIEALIGVGRLDEAAALVDQLERRAKTCDRPWVLAMGARCRGLLQAATGDVAAALASLESSTVEHQRLSQPIEQARTLLILGTVHRRARHQRAAREAIGEAKLAFDKLGALRWAERSSAELQRIGGRASAPLELTATEAQVAALVADGHTNREIAAALFISDKTVEANLTRIYRKMGVLSRRELVRRLRDGDLAHTGPS